MRLSPPTGTSPTVLHPDDLVEGRASGSAPGRAAAGRWRASRMGHRKSRHTHHASSRRTPARRNACVKWIAVDPVEVPLLRSSGLRRRPPARRQPPRCRRPARPRQRRGRWRVGCPCWELLPAVHSSHRRCAGCPRASRQALRVLLLGCRKRLLSRRSMRRIASTGSPRRDGGPPQATRFR